MYYRSVAEDDRKFLSDLVEEFTMENEMEIIELDNVYDILDRISYDLHCIQNALDDLEIKDAKKALSELIKAVG